MKETHLMGPTKATAIPITKAFQAGVCCEALDIITVISPQKQSLKVTDKSLCLFKTKLDGVVFHWFFFVASCRTKPDVTCRSRALRRATPLRCTTAATNNEQQQQQKVIKEETTVWRYLQVGGRED